MATQHLLACELPARIKLLSVWSGDKNCSETWSTDPAMIHTVLRRHILGPAERESSLSHTLRKSTDEATSEFCQIGTAPPTRLGEMEFVYSGIAGST